jgi:glyceraldehyde 3-phosphate dehydrogenase
MEKIAIHGFGRIGRSVLKAALRDSLFEPAVIADIKDLASIAAVFAVDSNYGLWPEPVRAEGDRLSIGDCRIRYVNSIAKIPDWRSHNVGLVIDCTGRATVRSAAQAHLDRGANCVLVSAPSKTLEDCDAVLLRGVNLEDYDPAAHHIVSMASCTTNALAPVVKVLQERFGIKAGLFSTVHAYTNTQSLTDQPMTGRRDSWAAAENIIPSSSGAAKALRFIWPDLNVIGKAYRVPVRTGSIVELNAVLERPTTVDAVRDAFREEARRAPLAGVMGVLEDEFASSRVVGERLSSLIDLPLVEVLDQRFVSVAAWYDNEMGYATRLAEVAATLSHQNNGQ